MIGGPKDGVREGVCETEKKEDSLKEQPFIYQARLDIVMFEVRFECVREGPDQVGRERVPKHVGHLKSVKTY